MAIQSSVNALMQQIYTIGAIGAGLREQKKQIKAVVASAPSFEERFRKEFNIDAETQLNPDQKKAVEYGEYLEKKRGSVVTPSDALKLTRHLEKANERRRSIMEQQRAGARVQNEIASDLARASVEARTASINKTKSNFNEHTASLIKYYSKGSGNP